MNNSSPEERELCERIISSDTVINKISDGITVSDVNGYFEIFNLKMQEITGYTKEEANSAKDFNELIHPDFNDRQNILASLSEIAKEKNCLEAETAVWAKDGTKKILLVSTSLIRYKNQDMFLSIWREVTQRSHAQSVSDESEIIYRRLFEAAQDGILILDAETGKITEANKFITDMLGYPRDELLGKKLWEIGAFINIEESKSAFEALQAQGYIRYENLPLQAKSGSLVNVEFVSNVYIADQKKVIQCNIRDITVRRRLEEEENKKFKEMALKDSHTGLYNYDYLKEALRVNFSRAEREATLLSITMMDLDYFKSINDVYGHLFGDLILKQFAMLLIETIRPYDVAIRYGGEEFIIISPDTSRAGALILANRILNKAQLLDFGDKTHVIKLKLSLAVATYPEDNVCNDLELLALVDQILIKAKESGGNRVYSSLNIGKIKVQTRESSDIHLLKDKIGKLNQRVTQSLVEETFAFAKSIEQKDHYTGEHSERTIGYAVGIARKLNLSQEAIGLIEQAAMLHDLGKVGISEKILLKKSKLSNEEFTEIKKHPQIGVDIIRSINSLHPIIPAILYHHERWDGKGYPYGFKKERIPLAARIISIADVYEALVSDRPYRKAYSKEKAVSIVKKASGTQFDPEIVEYLLKIL
ncbi:MAG TPA: diguanylate cyclase [Candidatus Omnitrophota bacterium]|nr:diguanylate cyclase [Candidatus Omnitrophota bacterium]HPT39100.1 diguanylate cyclase [Candidatus Omnitrophota bacterium]